MIQKAQQHRSFRGGSAAIAFVALLAAGCTSTPSTRSSVPPLEVAPRDFARSPGKTIDLQAAAAPVRAPANKVYGIEMLDPGELMSDIAIEVGAPNLEESAGPSLTLGGPVLVDAKVGEINGMPIFASEFLESLEPRLVALAVNEGLSLPQWRDQAATLIDGKLLSLISDELLKAEALSEISIERRGQIALWEDFLRQRELSRHYGSASIAENELGQSLDDEIETQLTRELIGMYLRQVSQSVQVTWHDIQLAYEQQHDRFNPPPIAKFHLIKVRDGDSESVQLIQDELESGKPFEDVAKLPENAYQNPELAFRDIEVKGEYAQASLFGIPAVNDAAHGLEVSGWTGPIVSDDDVFFLKLLEIDDKTVLLYDAQSILEQEILQNRQTKARLKRIMDLKADLTTENEQGIANDLLRIAEQKFYPSTS